MLGYSKGQQKCLKHNIEPGEESSTFVIVPDQHGQSEFQKWKSLDEQVLISNQILINKQKKMKFEEYDDFVDKQQQILAQKENESYDLDFQFDEKEPQINYKKLEGKNIHKQKYYLEPNPYYNYTQNILQKELSLNPPRIEVKNEFEYWLTNASFMNLRDMYRFFSRIRQSYQTAIYENNQHRQYYLNELQKNYPKWQMLYISWWTQQMRLKQSFQYKSCQLDIHEFKIKEILNMIPQMIWNIKNHYKEKNRQQLYYWINDKDKVTACLTIITGWGKNSIDNQCDSRTATINWCKRNSYIYHPLVDKVDIQIPLEG